jgi:fructose-1,6-bisphosphatase/inositol monophosphatase family enzyme
MGMMQFTIIGAPRMWDMLGGALAVQESGGTVMTRLQGRRRWHPMESLVPTWDEQPPTMAELRKWVAPLVAANPTLAPLVANNLIRRRRPVRTMWRRLKRKLSGGKS